MKQLGCSTVLYGGFDLDKALAGIAKAEYQAIELCARPRIAPHLEINRSASYYADIKRKINDYGLVIESISGTGGVAVDCPEFEGVVQAAQLMDVSIITISAGGKSNSEESFKRFIDRINCGAEYVASTGVRLSIKPRVGKAVCSVDTAKRFMDAVDQDQVGLNFDPTHIWRSQSGADPVKAISDLKSAINTVRIRDNRESRKMKVGPIETQIPGKGALDLQAIADIIKMMPQISYAVLEIIGMHGKTKIQFDEIQRIVEESIAYLKPMFFEYVATQMTTIV